MLILSRKSGERIRIGDNITVTLIENRGHSVRLGIDAPREVEILRTELIECPKRSPDDSGSTESVSSAR